ncbi:MAG: DUF1566 domain-containing protein [Methylococcaceae bacterium]
MKTRYKIIFSFLMVTLSSIVNATSIYLQVRDVMTNISIDANVEVNKRKYHLNAFEPFQANLPNGTYSISITADGYKPMQTDVTVGNNAPSEYKFMLEPQPSQNRQVKRQAMIAKDAVNVPVSNFYGYVTDSFGKPLAGVNVQAVESVISTSTDARGYFSFDVPIPSDIENPTQTLTWSLPNHKTLRRSNVLLIDEAQGYKIELLDGKGQIDILENEKLLKNETPSIGQVTVSKQSALEVTTSSHEIKFSKNARPFITVPTVIGVGFDCTKRNCKRSEYFPFETYVALGLSEEWMVNWDKNALKAGAIAYRSYAASFTVKPIKGLPKDSTKIDSVKVYYDICNSTYCQVFTGKKIPTKSVTEAVQETAGFMLTSDKETPSLSEYASITNGLPYPKDQTYYTENKYCKDHYQEQYNLWKTDKSKDKPKTFVPKRSDGKSCVKITTADKTATGCGDGFSGEPDYLKNVMSGGWWCLADFVQSGKFHFGHGRGMSQWGSQWWSKEGKDWSWILWHYYQEKRTPPAKKASKTDPTPYQEISSPVDTSKNAPTADKETASTGDTINLSWKVNNTSAIYNSSSNSDSMLKNLLFKATLESGSTSITLTNSNSLSLSLSKGLKELTNSFTIPSNVQSGTYTIKLQIWLDANKNNKVDEGDTNTDLLLGENKKLSIKVESKSIGIGFTKIANNGAELPDSAVLGTKPKDWACTKDNKTGLIWEVKTTDGGLRDQNKTYTWYNGDPTTNGYDLHCAKYPDDCKLRTNSYGTVYSPLYKPEEFIGYENNGQNTEAYTKAVNATGLCGSSNWRLPTNEELKSLVYCSDGKTTTPAKEESGSIECTGSSAYPAINTTYFDYYDDSYYWSSSPNARNSGRVWAVSFDYGFGYSLNSFDIMYDYNLVRLVH